MDSLEDLNYQPAKFTSEKLHSFFNYPARITLTKIKTPQQSNG